MKLENRIAYLSTGIFVTATLIIGAEVLYPAITAIDSGGQAMVDLVVLRVNAVPSGSAGRS